MMMMIVRSSFSDGAIHANMSVCAGVVVVEGGHSSLLIFTGSMQKLQKYYVSDRKRNFRHQTPILFYSCLLKTL